VHGVGAAGHPARRVSWFGPARPSGAHRHAAILPPPGKPHTGFHPNDPDDK